MQLPEIVHHPPPIRARLLGPTDLRVGARVVSARDWPRRQAWHVLLLLLAAAGHRLPRHIVLDALWPERISVVEGLWKAAPVEPWQTVAGPAERSRGRATIASGMS